MQIIDQAQAMQHQAMAWRAAGDDIGLVPTMGALHAGHESLVQRARRENRRVVASIFVNPLQFGEADDLARYPRPIERDLATLERLGVDATFHPEIDQIYPASFRTRVDPGPWGAILEGRSRPGHFGGVLTVVLKLFEIARPTRAYFGQKDAQQLLLVRQLVRDFCLPLRIVSCPTVREEDGLAISSRNGYLDATERKQAPALYRALRRAADAFTEGETDPGRLEGLARDGLASDGLTVDYVALFDEATLERPGIARPGNVMAGAVKLGLIRLIDNVILGAEVL
ncbi:MAG TPA: pantoate--beta-alanine ligase [Candidatus Limnocylindrales bacterium]|nr:pantoate--beta-alanine ligase [Candidatus Limnocylindrales bacterium]